MHALVLDTVQRITRNNQSTGYDIGDLKLIFKNTYDNANNGQPKKYTINAKSAMAPEIFYFLHIDVDLDQIQDCIGQEDDCENQINEESDSDTSASSESLQSKQEIPSKRLRLLL